MEIPADSLTVKKKITFVKKFLMSLESFSLAAGSGELEWLLQLGAHRSE